MSNKLNELLIIQYHQNAVRPMAIGYEPEPKFLTFLPNEKKEFEKTLKQLDRDPSIIGVVGYKANLKEVTNI